MSATLTFDESQLSQETLSRLTKAFPGVSQRVRVLIGKLHIQFPFFSEGWFLNKYNQLGGEQNCHFGLKSPDGRPACAEMLQFHVRNLKIAGALTASSLILALLYRHRIANWLREKGLLSNSGEAEDLARELDGDSIDDYTE